MRPEHRKYYGYFWRTKTRPRILKRDRHACSRCHRPWKPLDVAHLDGNPANDADDNLAVLCRKCHRANDYDSWLSKFLPKLKARIEKRREELRARLDNERPLLQMLKEAS